MYARVGCKYMLCTTSATILRLIYTQKPGWEFSNACAGAKLDVDCPVCKQVVGVLQILESVTSIHYQLQWSIFAVYQGIHTCCAYCYFIWCQTVQRVNLIQCTGGERRSQTLHTWDIATSFMAELFAEISAQLASPPINAPSCQKHLARLTEWSQNWITQRSTDNCDPCGCQSGTTVLACAKFDDV